MTDERGSKFTNEINTMESIVGIRKDLGTEFNVKEAQNV